MSSAPGLGFLNGVNGECRHGSARKEGFGFTKIHSLPTEILAHVLAQLSPSALGVAQLVCCEWHDVIADEASWRSAFETYYGIVDEQGAVALGRRLEPSSWRAEYIARVALLHRWSKSRTPSLTYNPNIGPLSAMHILFPAAPIQASAKSTPNNSPSRPPPSISPTLLALSLPVGIAAQSTPFTGKMAKGFLAATPTDNLGRVIHLPPIPATSFAISNDGGRIVWGMRDGTLRFTTCPTGGGRGWAGGVGDRGEVRAMEAHREGTEVVAVAFAELGNGAGALNARSDYFVSVGQDGVVAIWQLSSSTATAVRERPDPARRVWSARIPASDQLAVSGAPPARATVVAFDSGWGGRSNGRKATVAIGMSTGTAHVWRGIDLEGEVEGRSLSGDEQTVATLEVGNTAVDTLRLDPAPNRLALLAHSKDASTFHRFLLDSTSGNRPQQTTFGHKQDHLGSLTAFAFDFSSPPPLPAPLAAPQNAEGKVTSMTPHSAIGTPADTPSSELPPSGSTSSILSLASSILSTTASSSDHVALSNRPAPLTGANLFGRRKFVVAGDALGRTFLWDWEADEQSLVVEPSSMIQGFESKVTALEVSEAAVFVGGLDGTLRVYCPLTSTLLRTFKDRTAPRMPSRMLAQGLFDAEDEERWLVSHIRAGRGEVVAAVGGRILAWKVGGEVKKSKGKAPGAGRLSARSERFRSDFELRREVRESLDSLTSEQSDRLKRLGQERRVASEYGLPPSLNTMTEDEAVALALMLSAEEEESRWFSGSRSSASSSRGSPAWEAVPEELLDLDMDGLSLDGPETSGGRAFGNRRASSSLATEDAFDDEHYEQTPRTEARSLSLSVPTSPTLRGSSLGSSHQASPSRNSYLWRPSSATQHSPSFAAYEPHSYASSGGSPSNMKVQLSPRLGPTYGSNMPVPSGPVPDMSEDLWPTAAASSSPPSVSRKTSSPSPLPSPTFSRATPSSLTLDGTKPAVTPAATTPVRRGWSDVARSGPASAHSSPSASPSPASPWAVSSTSPAPKPSLLSDQLRRSGSEAVAAAERQSREDELRRREEEELRFAMELSLAEEASRLEL